MYLLPFYPAAVCRHARRCSHLKKGYLVTIGEDPTDRDTRWAKYLYEHLKKRANDDEIVAFGVSEMDMWRIIIQIDPTLQRGFKVACKGSDIRLTASDDKQMLWLQYQLIKKISKRRPAYRRFGSSSRPYQSQRYLRSFLHLTIKVFILHTA